jgi:hypothetical protein
LLDVLELHRAGARPHDIADVIVELWVEFSIHRRRVLADSRFGECGAHRRVHALVDAPLEVRSVERGQNDDSEPPELAVERQLEYAGRYGVDDAFAVDPPMTKSSP